jgi:hypothetical protein
VLFTQAAKEHRYVPNRDLHYPDMDRPAAFACAEGACSSPVYEAREIEPTVRKLTL